MHRRLRITVEGRQYDVTVEDLGAGETHLIPQPGDMLVPSPAPAPHAPPPHAPANAAPPSGPGDYLTPLAGVVKSIEVTVGQAVEQGQTIAIVEAMKMKTTLVADRTGKVTGIAVRSGDAVTAGQVIMTFE